MKILLVEDDLEVGRALQAVLQDDAYEVVWVRLTAEAQRLVAAGRFDGMLLDLGLPDGDGIDLLRTVRTAGFRAPVLVTTARESLEQRLAGFDAGADDYLIKPFDIPELLARLRAVLRRAHGGEAGALCEAGELVLDPRRMSVKRGGVPVALSKTEFSLLHVLMEAAHRVVARGELEDRVLPFSDAQTLDIHMSNLRKKIGDGYIRTVRGVGYMIERDDG